MKLIGKTTKDHFFKAIDTNESVKNYDEVKDIRKEGFKALCIFFEGLFDIAMLKYTYSVRKDYYRLAISKSYTDIDLRHQVNGRLAIRFFPKSTKVHIRINLDKKYLSILEAVGFKKQGIENKNYITIQKTLKSVTVDLEEVAEVFSSLLKCKILEKLDNDDAKENLLSLWLNESIIKALKSKKFELYHPVNQIKKIEKQKITRFAYNRRNDLAKKIKEDAKYKCAVDESHFTFLTEDGIPYMEAHHLIPMSMQGGFLNSLDVEENLLCICPTCHRNFHHGDDKNKLIKDQFNKRIVSLNNKGLEIELSSLLTAYDVTLNEDYY